MVDLRFHPSSGPHSLLDLLDRAGHTALLADPARGAIQIRSAGELQSAGADEICWAGSNGYAEALAVTRAGVVVVNAALAEHVPAHTVAIVAQSPQTVFLDLLPHIYGDTTRQVFIAQTEARQPHLAEKSVTLGANVVLGPGVEIGEGTIIGANTVIGANVAIGRNTIIGANCTIECAYIGDDVVIQPGVRIGVESFAFIDPGKTNRKVPQLGRAIIQDRVEIGANSAIDRGALGDTVIGEGTKIGNLVEISHNCLIGRNCIIVSCSAFAGSTILGDGVIMGGNVTTAGHLELGAGSFVQGGAALTKSWPPGSKLAGRPAQDIKDFWKETAAIRRLGKGDKQ